LADNPGVPPDWIQFDPDLYRGTAGYYDRFRIPYPQAMLDELVSAADLSGQGRLMDLACGTGQIAFALADEFAEVWAVDQEPDMIGVVRAKALAAGADHVRAVVARAEELDAPTGAFELVAIGNAFHRLRREAVAANARRWLQPNGYVALVWSTSPWAGEAAWQRAMSEVLERWRTKIGVQARVPASWDQVRRERPDVDVLTAAGFQPVGTERFLTNHDWTAEELIGFVYSTSALPKTVLGTHAEAFESDLRNELGRYAIGDKFQETIDAAYEIARRPN
jgi:ubiquinone/menaquinone biosynthesis C-methylase UbiE